MRRRAIQAGVMWKALPLVLGLALPASPAVAEELISVDSQTVAASPGRSRKASVRWSLSKEGEVSLRRTHCPQCRAIISYHYRFAIEPNLVRRIEALLPGDVVEAATRAPCTLPHAETGWARPVHVSVPNSSGGSRFTSFFDTCESPELAALRERLKEATQLLLDEIVRRDLQPDS